MMILDNFIFRKHTLVLDEGDVINTLKAIQAANNKILSWQTVGNCGWEDKQKWFIRFTCSNKVWNVLRNDLGLVRVFKYSDIPENTGGNIYTTD